MYLCRPIAAISIWLLSASAPSLAQSANEGDSPAVVARFELSVAPAAGGPLRRQTWLLWREADRVETRTKNGDGEIWRRNPRGDVHYQRVFHRQKRTIDYTAGDLRALDAVPDWARLAHTIDPALLGAELKRIESTTALGRPAVRYRGKVRGVRQEVVWLARERLPAWMRMKYRDRTVTVRLKEVHALAQSPWPRARTNGYAATDYADIGDNEADPFLRRLLNEAGPAHAH